MTTAMNFDIEKLIGRNYEKSLIIIGNRHPIYNESMIRGEQLVWSFYERESDAYVRAYWNALGFLYKDLSEEQEEQAGA